MKPQSWSLPALDWAAIESLAKGRHVCADSRAVVPGSVFLAFQGEYADGRQYIADAIAKGAAAVLWEAEDFEWHPEWAVPNLAIPQLRAQAGLVASYLLGEPSRAMWTVGVTGTNGKTSCAHWLTQAFGLLGHSAAMLGTIGYGFLQQLAEASHTTPDAVRLQQWLAQFRAEGATHVTMEVSSHGLEQARAHGVAFQVALFTNLTRDHLDYHGDMAQYGAAKAKLFAWEGLSRAIINRDDPFGAALASSVAVPVWTYGLHDGDIHTLSVQSSLNGLQIEVQTPQGTGHIESKLIGQFNVYNLLGCLGVLLASGVALADACAVLGKIESARGRMERIGGDREPLVVVDYAHTPDALEKALTTLRSAMTPAGKLYCVFGCGGDRDRGKRPLMGRIASDLADYVVLTNDNPRTEDPQRILSDIVEGVCAVVGDNELHYCIESDRSLAIRETIKLAGPGDVVLIAGKGHETYQDMAGVKSPFNDLEVALAGLVERAGSML